MEAVDFVLYCLGTSTVLVAAATAVRLIRTPRPPNGHGPQTPKWEAVPETPADGLVERLEAFQAARYASPIIQRKLDPDAVPPRWPVSPRRPAPRMPKDDKVVSIPTRTKKDPEED